VPGSLPRLKKRAEFLRVAGLRLKWAAPGLILQIGPRSDEAPTGVRVGFTASRKVGNAVLRNRSRRRLKAAAAEIMPAEARSDCDYVLIARPETAKRPFNLLLEDLRTALRRVKTPRNTLAGNTTESPKDRS
jgi:ribonuclease P protein component